MNNYLQILTKLAEKIASNPGSCITPNERPTKTWQVLSHDLGGNVSIVGPTGPTNSSDVIAISGGAELWLSVFGNLATVLWSDKIDQMTMDQIIQILECNGWTVIPEVIITAPLSNERPQSSWFMEFFGEY